MHVQNTNPEYRHSRQIRKQRSRSPRHYDLEERTLRFAKDFIVCTRQLPRTMANCEYARQLIRSAGSVGANYIEANESLGKKDFLMRIKISRKEAKESRYWLKLIEPSAEYTVERARLAQEAGELMNIFGAILRNSQ